jgi:hypothetical protein
LTDNNHQQAVLDAWAGACEIVRRSLVTDPNESQFTTRGHTAEALEELLNKHGGAGALALLITLADLACGLLLTAADASDRTPEGLLDLMQLLAYEEDADI